MAAYLLKSFGHSVAKCLKRASNCSRFGYTRANFHSTPWNLKKTCPDRAPFITRLALPVDYDKVVEFMSGVFYKTEPSLVNSGLSESEIPPLWTKMIEDQVKYGLSIIAENRDHCIIGAALNTPATEGEIQSMYDMANCCDAGPIGKVFEFYGFVAESSNLWERYCVHTLFEQTSLAVDEEYQGLGIGRRLVMESWILARDCGYRLFRLDCNSIYCARMCRSFGWNEVWSIPFSQYVSNGEVVFCNVKEPHTECRVFADDLSYCKTFDLPYKKNKTGTPPAV